MPVQLVPERQQSGCLFFAEAEFRRDAQSAARVSR
jgi:hypothetical protein